MFSIRLRKCWHKLCWVVFMLQYIVALAHELEMTNMDVKGDICILSCDKRPIIHLYNIIATMKLCHLYVCPLCVSLFYKLLFFSSVSFSPFLWHRHCFFVQICTVFQMFTVHTSNWKRNKTQKLNLKLELKSAYEEE